MTEQLLTQEAQAAQEGSVIPLCDVCAADVGQVLAPRSAPSTGMKLSDQQRHSLKSLLAGCCWNLALHCLF